MLGQILGPIVGFAGVLFAVYVYVKNRKPKRLQYEVHTNQRIVPQSRYTKRWSNLSVRFGNGAGRTLKNARIVAIRVENSGKVEAREDDFVEPLSVECSSGGEIIAAKIVLNSKGAKESRELEPAQLNGREVSCPRILLNERDSLEIILLVDGQADSFKLSGRVAGFEINPVGQRKNWAKVLSTPSLAKGAATVAAIASLTLSLILFSHENENNATVPSVAGMPLDRAAAQLNSAHLRVGEILRLPKGGQSNVVISTLPAAGQKAKKGSKVSLVVSAKP
ncbi:PASTA domain-containing protein [Streptomyces chartreusis]